MPLRSGLKTKRIEAGEPLFISEGKRPEPADNSAAGSFFEVGLERPRSPHGWSTQCPAAPSLQHQRRHSSADTRRDALVRLFTNRDAKRRHRDRGRQCPCHSHNPNR
jgi:hypothetical protein